MKTKLIDIKIFDIREERVPFHWVCMVPSSPHKLPTQCIPRVTRIEVFHCEWLFLGMRNCCIFLLASSELLVWLSLGLY
jgi:hypothetical protein